MGKEIGVRVQGQDRKVYYRNPDSERIRMYYEYTEDNFRKGKDYNLEVSAELTPPQLAFLVMVFCHSNRNPN